MLEGKPRHRSVVLAVDPDFLSAAHFRWKLLLQTVSSLGSFTPLIFDPSLFSLLQEVDNKKGSSIRDSPEGSTTCESTSSTGSSSSAGLGKDKKHQKMQSKETWPLAFLLPGRISHVSREFHGNFILTSTEYHLQDEVKVKGGREGETPHPWEVSEVGVLEKEKKHESVFDVAELQPCSEQELTRRRFVWGSVKSFQKQRGEDEENKEEKLQGKIWAPGKCTW